MPSKVREIVRREGHALKNMGKAILFPFALPFVAGSHRGTAIRHARRMSREGRKALINYLGEHCKTPEEVQENLREYFALARDAGRAKKHDPNFRVSISIKPSQFGFDLVSLPQKQRENIAFENMHTIVAEAHKHGIDVEMDMEHSKYTDFTFDTYKLMLKEFKNGLTLCVQANLKRTESDIGNLILFGRYVGAQPRIRIVKGIYPEAENPEAIHDETGIVNNYKNLIRLAFANGKQLGIAVASHRGDIFELADSLSKKTGIAYERQMLKGIAPSLRKKLVKQGGVTDYLPYGLNAFAYGSRRLKKFLKILGGGLLHSFGKGK